MAQRGYINFAWGQLHYRSINIDTDLPMLIMLHQSPLSSRNYEKLLPYLSKKLRVVAIDTPGFGSSDRLSVDWEVNDYAKMVFDCADHFNVSTFNLFGRATGSVFALEASLMNSDRIKNLIIHGIPVYSPEERKQRLVDFAPPFKITNDGNEDAFLKLVKDITSKGFVRNKYKDKLIDLSNVRINLKSNK